MWDIYIRVVIDQNQLALKHPIRMYRSTLRFPIINPSSHMIIFINEYNIQPKFCMLSFINFNNLRFIVLF